MILELGSLFCPGFFLFTVLKWFTKMFSIKLTNDVFFFCCLFYIFKPIYENFDRKLLRFTFYYCCSIFLIFKIQLPHFNFNLNFEVDLFWNVILGKTKVTGEFYIRRESITDGKSVYLYCSNRLCLPHSVQPIGNTQTRIHNNRYWAQRKENDRTYYMYIPRVLRL